MILHQGWEPLFNCGADGCRFKAGFCFSLTCLRLHREIWLALQYAVHQPGTVAVGGVISICSCHLHHWSTYRTDTQTWQTSQEMTLPQWFGPRMVWQTSLSQSVCLFPCLHWLDGKWEWKTLFQTLQLNCSYGAGLQFYFSTFHHCWVETATIQFWWFSCF